MYTQYASHIRRDADGAVIPIDPLNPDYRAFLEWMAQGNEPNSEPQPTIAELILRAWAEMRAARKPIIDVLDGLQSTALTKGELEMAQIIETAKQALRDITKLNLTGCTTYEEMKALTLARYAEIASASPALKSAFSEALK